ncbi:MAG: glycosyltransferase [Bacteriovorax sp.]|nr:glycosyltransferase [Bacteriovorax sp.]
MEIFFLLCLVFWIIFLGNLLRGLKNLESLDQFSLQLSGELIPIKKILPKISIVVAVKDEERLIRGTLLNLLKLDYENLEIIVVNDRSTDQTQKIIEEFTIDHQKFKVVKISKLPEGWLGKVNALNEGTKIASGDFLLYMDPGADIAGSVLEMSTKVCESYQLDHLTILPNISPKSFWPDVLITTAFIFYVSSGRPWLAISKRPIGAAKGVGQYNFVRRSFLSKTEGFEWLKMEVADDVGLAQLIASSGGKSHFMKTGNFKFDFNWYSTVKEIIYGLEKNTVGAFANYNLGLGVLIFLLTVFCSFYPLVAIFMFRSYFIIGCGIAYLLAIFIFSLVAKKWLKQPLGILLILPLGISIIGYILLRSSYLCFRNGGISWSGTFYPVDSLRKGKRIKFGF